MIKAAFTIMIALALSLAFEVGSKAQEPDPDRGQSIEEIEELEDIEIVEPQQPPGFLEILGRFHPAVVHIPIGWLMMVVIIDLVTFVVGREDWAEWGFYALGGTVLSFFPAILTGFLKASTLATDSPIFSLMETHRNLNMLVVSLCILAFLVRLGKRNRLEGRVRQLYLGLILLSAALLTISGHIGGEMVFGENYLPL